MVQSITDLFLLFQDLLNGIVSGIDTLLFNVSGSNLSSFSFDLYLFSDNKIITFNLQQVLSVFLVIVVGLFLYKLIKFIISLPYLFLKGRL